MKKTKRNVKKNSKKSSPVRKKKTGSICCNRCGTYQSSDSYYGYNKVCKKCFKIKSALYYIENKQKVNSKNKEYYLKNKEEIINRTSNYHKTNYEWATNYKKLYRIKNRDKNRSRERIRYKTDIQFKLSYKLRKRLNIAIRNSYKSGSAVSDLGCSIAEFKVYLENKFTEGMNWGNYGVNGWHIDHIIPLSSFDLTNRKELLKAVHYTNLQPLWAIDNIRKGANL